MIFKKKKGKNKKQTKNQKKIKKCPVKRYDIILNKAPGYNGRRKTGQIEYIVIILFTRKLSAVSLILLCAHARVTSDVVSGRCTSTASCTALKRWRPSSSEEQPVRHHQKPDVQETPPGCLDGLSLGYPPVFPGDRGRFRYPSGGGGDPEPVTCGGACSVVFRSRPPSAVSFFLQQSSCRYKTCLRLSEIPNERIGPAERYRKPK